MTGRRIVLLQGPLGPFFSRLASQLALRGCVIHKINFNGGDWLFSHSRSIDTVTNFTGTVDEWPHFFRDFVTRYRITDCVIYGDCRYYHQQAYQVAQQLGLGFWSFEEGYLRPDFVTLEPGRVNGYSELDRRRQILQRQTAESTKLSQLSANATSASDSAPDKVIGQTFAQRMLFAMLYYWAFSLAVFFFPHYRHHRRGRMLYEGLCWCRSGWRKLYYAVVQWRFAHRFSARWHGRFFLAPLQVHNDSQILYHSRYTRVEQFIEQVMAEFARHAPPNNALLFKHHPIDRGFVHYQKLIRQLGEQHGIADRVFYCFDAHLPTLERHARGAVTINSTVGLSCLLNGLPTKTMGRAIYSIRGITSDLPLRLFFQQPQPVDRPLVTALRRYLRQKTQLNGNFYKQMPFTCRSAAQHIVSQHRLQLVAPESEAAPCSAEQSARLKAHIEPVQTRA